MTELDDLPPFDPPYLLAGTCLAVVGLWDRAAHDPPLGFRPVRLFGRPAAVVIANHYTEPPAALPIRYREVIAASLVRRGLSFSAVPFDMVLDEALPVELGRLHYALPKRLDATLAVHQQPGTFAATASDLELRASSHGGIASACALPIRVAFALAVRAVTASIDVLGVTHPPSKRARIALRPRGIGQSWRVTAGRAGGIPLRTLWCQSWSWTATDLGAPHPLETKGSA
ncbi:hypothetical protein BH11MYX4_BH11MYX4_15340 [soil metagenome]